MSKNIILVGFMGTGKNLVGKEIAKKIGHTFFSTDEFIERSENKTISKIFELFGEAYFRKIEKATIGRIKDLKNIVLATGGGSVIDPENRHHLSQMGKVVHLDAKVDIIEKRLKDDHCRPLIKDKDEIRRLLKRRIGLYNFARVKIDTSDKEPAAIADEIINKLHLCSKNTDRSIETITVKTSSKNYPVYIGSDILAQFLKLETPRATVVTNPIVGTLYLQKVIDALKGLDIATHHLIIPDGENYKNLKTANHIYNFLLENRVTRSEPIIGLGGGVIGDLVGFIASTYKRGLPLIQVPTTLLAQVDAAIGGKTGLDHRLGKNMIGTFYQPDIVICDISALLTLSESEFLSGLVEVIKYAIIKDRSLFSLLKNRREEILNRDLKILKEIVSRCVSVKKDIVEIDEREEKGIREILNFGHTIGHAIETSTGYSLYDHGKAVAIGMVVEAKWAKTYGSLRKQDLNRITDLISSYRLPTTIPKDLSIDNLNKLILQDKKVRNKKIRLPVIEAIGKVISKEVECKKFL